MNKKLATLESIRGLAALSVVLGHFLIAFYPAAALGIGNVSHSGYEAIIFNTPLNIFTSADFAVTLFFVLSGFVLTLSIFKKEKDIIAQVVKRYFRLMPVALSAVLMAYFLVSLNFMYNNQAAAISGSAWLGQFWNFDISFIQAFFEGLFGIFIVESDGVKSLDPVLWTLYYELLGSILIYSFVNLIKNDSRRWLIYFIAIISFSNTRFVGFLLGALLADLYVNKNFLFQSISKLSFVYKVFILTIGLVFASLPAYAPPEYLSDLFSSIVIFPNYFQLSKNIIYTIASVIIIVSSLSFKRLEGFLSIKPLIWLGSLSYSLYATHLLVLGSIVSFAFIKLNSVFSYNITALISFFLLIIGSLAVATVFRKYIDIPSIKISNKIGSNIQKMKK